MSWRRAADGGTRVTYDYEAAIGGKVASIGGRLLDGAAKMVIRQFFAALARQAGGGAKPRPVRPPVREARMKPARFDYLRAAISARPCGAAEHGNEARVLAGGQTCCRC